MKLIDYEFLAKEEQKKEKGIMLENGEIIHLIKKNPPHKEVIIICNEEKFEAINCTEYYNQKKECKKKENS